ncbi:uncharacterized protein LOC136095197 [Hydra vulgaris]|uniref:uncharacterized protein LOC136095197 n=1 Tax=Hydra vulgaris TaxID=6087 RepID=UPI0032EA2F18
MWLTSLINNKNRLGPRTLFCGTPLVTDIAWEITLFKFTTCDLMCRKLVSQFRRLPTIPLAGCIDVDAASITNSALAIFFQIQHRSNINPGCLLSKPCEQQIWHQAGLKVTSSGVKTYFEGIQLQERCSTPLDWKQSHVTPLFKKGSRLDAANYRPVSITSVPCKVMENIIKKQITKYLEKTSCISNNQHGFMSKKECTSNLLESIDFITKALSKRNFVDIAFLDFAKAFDKVSHRRLIHKLKAYGINGNVGKWIESFLTSRKQRTVLGNHSSDWTDVLSGVLQGSVLGPTLFIIYINDLTDNLKLVHKIYADDTKLLQEIRPEFHDADCLILQNDLNIISEWSKEWLMELNVAKCKVMHFGHGNINHDYVMNDGNTSLIIAATDIERDLGIFLSNDLKWNQHIQVATRRANMILGLLKKTFRSRDIRLWGKLYTTYVRPHLEFAVPVWCPYLKSDIKEIEKIQHKATKIPHDITSLP